ncbi:MAG: hypothetical protein ABI520_07000 [Caldimonas sp.]
MGAFCGVTTSRLATFEPDAVIVGSPSPSLLTARRFASADVVRITVTIRANDRRIEARSQS